MTIRWCRPTSRRAAPSTGVTHSNSFQCTDLEWTERVGTRVAPATTWTYPTLPEHPGEQPAGLQSTPVPDRLDRMPGDLPRPLRHGDHARLGRRVLPPVGSSTISPSRSRSRTVRPSLPVRDARVAVKSTRPCLLDPRTIDLEATSITGRGATFLLDETASVDIDDGQLFMNRRISTPSTRGSEGVAIRAIQTSEINTADLYVPEDQVVTGLDSNGDRILEPASSFTVDGGSLQYSGLTSPDVDTATRHRRLQRAHRQCLRRRRQHLHATGQIRSSCRQSRLRVVARRRRRRIAAESWTFRLMPSGPNDWYFGVDASPLLRRVELVATATMNGKTARSVSSFQVNSVGELRHQLVDRRPGPRSTGRPARVVGRPMVGPRMVGPRMVGPPMVGRPMVGPPMVGRRMVGRPMVGRPMVGRPMVGRPMVGRPMVGPRMVGRPMVGRPMVGRPMVGRPMVGRPMVGRPMVGRPMVGRPMVGPRMVGRPMVAAPRRPRAPTRPSGRSPTGTTSPSPVIPPTKCAATRST